MPIQVHAIKLLGYFCHDDMQTSQSVDSTGKMPY